MIEAKPAFPTNIIIGANKNKLVEMFNLKPSAVFCKSIFNITLTTLSVYSFWRFFKTPCTL